MIVNKRIPFVILTILLLVLIFLCIILRDRSENIVCLMNSHFFLKEDLNDLAREYKVKSGFSIKYVFPREKANAKIYLLQVINMLEKNPEKFDVIMVLTHPTLHLEEQKIVASYFLDEDNYSLALDDYTRLGVNRWSDKPDEALQLIQTIVEEYKQGLLYIPIWERKKIKASPNK